MDPFPLTHDGFPWDERDEFTYIYLLLGFHYEYGKLVGKYTVRPMGIRLSFVGFLC